ncbi:hypothetical protein D3C81_2160150 [compost metagenome]
MRSLIGMFKAVIGISDLFHIVLKTGFSQRPHKSLVPRRPGNRVVMIEPDHPDLGVSQLNQELHGVVSRFLIINLY